MISSTERNLRLEQLMPLILERLDAGQTVTFSPRGVSMLPMLRQGLDTVELSPVPARLNKYDLPLYRRKSGQYVLHRIVAVTDAYTCVGDNQFDLEYPLHHDQMLALVTAFTRNGRRISVQNPIYQLYCRFWHLSRPIRRFWRRGKGWLRRRFKPS